MKKIKRKNTWEGVELTGGEDGEKGSFGRI